MESHVTLVRSLVASVPAGMLFAGSLALSLKGKAPSSLLQLLGAGCLVVVVLAHICEALHLFPSMEWGLEGSAGHYLDLGSAVLGLTSFPLGYLLHTLHLKPR
jgi:succinate dehydrogenase/fumarate reductase cytochrome b subunit